MKHRASKLLACVLIAVLLAGLALYGYLAGRDEREYSRVTYNAHCADCHGANLQGSESGVSLLTPALANGDTLQSLMDSISADTAAHRTFDLPADGEKKTLKALALYVSERRQEYPSIAASYKYRFEAQTVESDHHRFRVEEFAKLAGRPYSIAPLPDGRIVVSEKVRGLSMVDSNGSQGALLVNTPPVHEPLASFQGQHLGWGQYLDVALHPDYAHNGWIYLSYTDRCQWACFSPVPQSMVKVVRGRIVDDRWQDEETIWSVHRDYYTVVPDAVAGGRLAFDHDGHLYLSIGGKATYDNLHILDTPYGKIHRVRDDGSVPKDNPFWTPADQEQTSSTRHTVWSYGHRTTQGLEGHPVTSQIWSSEMGPRGGDEINLIQRGGNYGWPLYTRGLDYDSTAIAIGKDLGLDFPEQDTIAPIVDFTPAPAISNLTFHEGSTFPGWKNDILVGSLKAMTLYRVRIDNGVIEEQETLATGLGRIRDVAMGADGLVYLAVENAEAGSILRLVPLD